jgi:SsrA-binding protein
LLLHRRELGRLYGAMGEKGLTLVPLRMYFKRGRAKLELGLVRGRKLYDKREKIREREEGRQAARAIRHNV